MTNEILKFKAFITEVQKRLSTVHNVSGFNIGKNKITFNVNNIPVKIIKDYDEYTSKIVVTCNDMFPCAISTDIVNKEILLKSKDVVTVVNALDTYFISLIGYDESRAMCSRYEAAKYLILPFFIYDYRKRKAISSVQEDLLYYLSYKLDNDKFIESIGYVFIFTGVNKKNNKENRAFIFILRENKAELYGFNCKHRKINPGSGELLAELPFDKYSNTTGISIIRNKLKNYTCFKMCDADIDILLEEEYCDE